MTDTAAVASSAPATRAQAPPAPVWRTYRFELHKLLAQWPIRALFLACALGPGLFVAIVSQQSSLPADTAFGRWMGQSGWAGPLVMLSFACSWVLPLLTSLVAGDIFAMEDRLGTWRQLLVTVRSPPRIFAAKALASLTVIGLLAALLLGSGIVGGLAAVGHQPLPGLDGHPFSSGQAAVTVVLAWASVLAPTLAFAAVGLLGSVTLGRSPLGLIVPALLALVLGIAQLLTLPVIVRAALPSYGFIAWRGLFTEPGQVGPVLVAVAVDLIWALLAAGLAYRLFLRRDFTDLAYDGIGRRVVGQAVLPLAALLAVSVGVLAAVIPAAGTGITRPKLDRSLATVFAQLYVRQTDELHRPHVTAAQLHSGAGCSKGGPLTADSGPGNDWRCTVSWRLPGSGAVGAAVYELDVSPDGRYVADGDGPQEVNGFFALRTARGSEPNPLWEMDGTIDLLAAGAGGSS